MLNSIRARSDEEDDQSNPTEAQCLAAQAFNISLASSKEQLADFISSLHAHVASLLRHMVGSVVVEHAYQLGNATQKQALLMELYSTELQLFKDLVSLKAQNDISDDAFFRVFKF
ncbi:hypothetical protein L1887_19487 [Cichorium endivia]|nr:hypothetical protein L1887_19487 [Cichorium endivia]